VIEIPMPRGYTTDVALRPQPIRTGPDGWTTPRCLIAVLINPTRRHAT